MAEVFIGSLNYHVYEDLAYVDDYLAAASHAANYRAEADDTVKTRWAVTATRILDRQTWKGSKTEDDQNNAWPRTGTGVDGVEDDVTPNDILYAYCEIISELANGGDLQTTQNQAQKIKSMGAGPAKLDFFRGAEGPATRWPQIIQELLRSYLSTPSSSLDSASSSGTDTASATANEYDYDNAL